MPSHLAPCAQCRHYIRMSELACPFCGAAQTTPELQATPRMARGAALVLSMALAGCGQAEPAPIEAPTVVELAPAVEVSEPVAPPVEPPAPVEPQPVVEAAPEVPAVAEPPAEPPAPPPPAIVRPQPLRPMMARYGRPPTQRDDDPFGE